MPVGIIGASKQDRHTRGVKMYFNIGKPIPYSNDTENMVKIWTSEIEELTNLEKLEKKINKNKKNYARKYAKDFNIWTRLYQYWAMVVIYWPVHLFYKIKWQGRKHLDKKKQYLLAPNVINSSHGHSSSNTPNGFSFPLGVFGFVKLKSISNSLHIVFNSLVTSLSYQS